jgi:hypothetical protein
MRAWEIALTRFMDASHPEIGHDILEQGKLTEETEASLRDALGEFSGTWQ